MSDESTYEVIEGEVDPRLEQTDNSGEEGQPVLPQDPDWEPNPDLLAPDPAEVGFPEDDR